MTTEFTKHSMLARELGGEHVHVAIAALERLFAELSVDYDTTKALAAKRSGELTHLKAQVRSLKAEIAKQAERIAELLHQQFGSKSEIAVIRRRRSSTDGDDKANRSNEDSPSDKNKDFSVNRPKKPRNTNGRGPKNWDHLEHIEIDMGFPETCTCGCGGGIRGYDVDEKREVIPAKFYVAVRKYPRYRCRRDDVTIGTVYSMARVKSLITQTTFDQAKRSHNCQANSRHRIGMGDTRLNVRNGRSWDRYCLTCAKEILRRDAEKISQLRQQLEV